MTHRKTQRILDRTEQLNEEACTHLRQESLGPDLGVRRGELGSQRSREILRSEDENPTDMSACQSERWNPYRQTVRPERKYVFCQAGATRVVPLDEKGRDRLEDIPRFCGSEVQPDIQGQPCRESYNALS